jgi:hypothetical protein
VGLSIATSFRVEWRIPLLGGVRGGVRRQSAFATPVLKCAELAGDSLCPLVILNEDLTVFKNATTEPCLLANPLVIGEFGLRFYAGAPIKRQTGI